MMKAIICRFLVAGTILASLSCGSSPDGSMHSAADGVAFRAGTKTQWPLWPTRDGWLIGGTGYTTGYAPPEGVAPGLGHGLVLLPDGTPRKDKPKPDQAETVRELATPWGGVRFEAGPLPEAGVLLGFPPADGTPVAGPFVPILRQRGPQVEVLLFDAVSRSVQRPTATLALNNPIGIRMSGNILLLTFADPDQPHLLVDILSGALDPLTGLDDALPGIKANLSAQARWLAYTAGKAGERRIQLFDRQSRMIDRLERLNRGGDHFFPVFDQWVRQVVYVANLAGQTDVHLYDTLAGLVDTLPRLNSTANELGPAISDSGRWLSFISDRSGVAAAAVYDLATEALEDVPEINALGPVRRLRLTPDGQKLHASVLVDGRLRFVIYDRASHFVDPVPEVNAADADVFF